jgi:hypothetical protein
MKIREFSFYILNEKDLELFYSHYCNITKFVRFSLMCHLFKSYDFVECSLKKSCLGEVKQEQIKQTRINEYFKKITLKD